MFDNLKAVFHAVTLTRMLVALVFGFSAWLMIIFTLEFAGVIDIDLQCGTRCMHLIDELLSLVKPARAADVEFGAKSAPLLVQVRFLP